MNKCHNCKFMKFGDWENICTSDFKLDINDGVYEKKYQTVDDVREDLDTCPHYKHNLYMKLKLGIGILQGWWYTKKFPEKII